MPDYSKSIEIKEHYILINQDESGELHVEELIWYHNTGAENFTGTLYVWSQPNDILVKIDQFGYVIDEEFVPAKLYPSQFSPNFLYGNLSEENLTIEPESKLEVVYKYTLKFSSTEEFSYYRTFLYKNEDVIVIIETNDGIVAEGKNNIELIYNAESDSFITSHSESTSMELGDDVTIEFKKDDGSVTGDDENNDKSESSISIDPVLIFIVIIIVIGLVISIISWLRKKNK
jgi:hypothetical protein